MKKTYLASLTLLMLTACGGDNSESGSGEHKVTYDEDATDKYETTYQTEEETSEIPTVDDYEVAAIEETEDLTADDEVADETESGEETTWQKTKGVYKAAKNKVKTKKDEWKEEHQDQIDEAKEKGRNLKKKTKEKVNGWLDRTRERLEE